MATEEVLNKTPLSLAEVKAKLSSIKKRDEELNFRANKVQEYISAHHIMSQKDAKELASKLEELDLSRIKDVHIKKIVDLLPETEDDLKVILSGYNITQSSDNVKKILDAVKGYLPKNK
ncbi:MAG: hypothetical protein ACLFUO_02575 [Candidatus Woesearchaeota archaeon]